MKKFEFWHYMKIHLQIYGQSCVYQLKYLELYTSYILYVYLKLKEPIARIKIKKHVCEVLIITNIKSLYFQRK